MIDVCGKPLVDCTVTAENKLWWPMTEALYALMLAIELTGGEEMTSRYPLRIRYRFPDRSLTASILA